MPVLKRRSRAGQRNYARGRWAERAARIFLALKGYRLLASRYKTPVGEIDLVVRRGRVLVFVEVKVRDTLTAASQSITESQQARITRAASMFLARHPQYTAFVARFDVVLLRPWRWPVHILDSWRPLFRLN